MDAKETVGFKESERSATLELHKVRLTVATELIIITIEVRTMEKDVRFADCLLKSNISMKYVSLMYMYLQNAKI